MRLQLIDWIIVAVTLVICFAPALFFGRRAGRNTSEFFASGRAVPWWLGGLSMVATTFSSDTPNLVTDIVRRNGVAGNWVWWAFVLTGVATVFFYARLWRRSGVLTDLEFYEIRYSGRAASVVRGFRAVYLGLFFNCMIMAVVNLAGCKIAGILFGLDRWQTLAIVGADEHRLCRARRAVGRARDRHGPVLHQDVGGDRGGLFRGQCAGSGRARRAHRPAVGDAGPERHQLPEHPARLHESVGPGGRRLHHADRRAVVGGVVSGVGARRGQLHRAAHAGVASPRRDSLGAVLFFNIAHYVLRPWPWILVALASIVVYPELSDIQAAFPDLDPSLIGHDIAYPAMLKFLPVGFIGLMVGGLIAASSSTILTHLNWGASYLVNDFYRRFIRGDADEAHYVRVGRLATVGLFLCSSGLVYLMDTAKDAFDVILQVGAGTGLLYLVRWFWWRVNAWCEVVAMVSSLLVSLLWLVLARAGSPVSTHVELMLTVLVTTVCWLAAAYLAPPTDSAVLEAFYRKVRPPGPGWARVRRDAGLPADDRAPGEDLPRALLGWLAGCTAIWSSLFAVGNALYGRTGTAWALTGVAVVSTLALVSVVRRLWTATSRAS